LKLHLSYPTPLSPTKQPIIASNHPTCLETTGCQKEGEIQQWYYIDLVYK